MLAKTTLDERFWSHRQRSTSIAGVTGAMVAIGLFAYRYYVGHVLDWDLFAVAAIIAIVKLAAMAYFYVTE